MWRVAKSFWAQSNEKKQFIVDSIQINTRLVRYFEALVLALSAHFFGYADIFPDSHTIQESCDSDLWRELANNLTSELSKQEILLTKMKSFFNRVQTRTRILHPQCPVEELEISSTPIFPKNCAEITDITDLDRPHQIEIPGFSLQPFYVFCMKDEGNGSAWNIILRRQKDGFDFDLKWNDFQHGFGALSRDHWLGLNAIHALTNYEPHELWIHMQLSNGDIIDVNYANFAIRGEEAGYSISVLGQYSGTGHDSLKKHSGEEFATRDRDTSNKCAKKHKGGWWFYKETKDGQNCRYSNLNGKYGVFSDAGMYWHEVEPRITITTAFMAIRPVRENIILND